MGQLENLITKLELLLELLRLIPWVSLPPAGATFPDKHLTGRHAWGLRGATFPDKHLTGATCLGSPGGGYLSRHTPNRGDMLGVLGRGLPFQTNT